ncbi:hypothetical protein DOS84_07305 [Flavobacterium aquariorum]|uniref:Uncharacterized protein n=1 Tax=Flavobacterium aquariorum TaxID=2217670 RepID=A0A2W7TZZ0_9FLAO|nr:hypothetical protein DOS84_07305 [Flavobacterium aquariorum]
MKVVLKMNALAQMEAETLLKNGFFFFYWQSDQRKLMRGLRKNAVLEKDYFTNFYSHRSSVNFICSEQLDLLPKSNLFWWEKKTEPLF